MAITARAVGAWAANNATTQTVTLPTHAAGDMLILRTIRKPFTSPDNTVCNTSGWTAVGTGVANGSTANGVGVGSMGFKAFYKIATSAAETNPVVTWGTTAAPGASVAVSYQKAATEAWVTPTGTGGGDATARTSQTSTMSSHISVTVGDLVDFFRGQCDDSGALTVPTITQTGVTYDTVTEYPATALLDGTSNDIAADGGYRTATAGTSSAAAVITGTSAASEEHGAWMTRLRVQPLITIPLLDATTATTLIFVCGGEAASEPGTSSHWSSTAGTVTKDATHVRSGSDALKMLAAGDSKVTHTLPAGQRVLVARFSVWMPATPAGLLTIVDWNDGVSTRLLVRDAGDTLLYMDFGASTLPFPLDQWVTIDIKLDTTADPHVWDWKINGVAQTQKTRVAAASDIVNIRFRSENTGLDVWHDDIAISYTAADYPIPDGSVSGSPEVWSQSRLYAPSLTQTAAVVTVPLLDAAPALYAPTIASAAQAITLGLLDAGPTVYAPTLATVNTLTIGLLTSTSDLYAPALVGKNTLTLGTVDASNALYAPTLTVGAVTLTVPHLDAGSAVYAPTLIPGAVTLTIPNLDAGPTVYAPTLATVNTLTIGLLDSGSAVYAPAVIPDQLVIVPNLDASNALYAPTLTVGAVTLTIPLLDSGPAVYQPIVSTGEIFIDLAFLDASRAVYAPALTQTSPAKSVTLGLLTSSRALYAPSLELTGEQPLESGGLSIFDLRLVYRTPTLQKMRLPVLVSRASLYEPVVVVDDDAEVFELLALA